MLLSFLFLSLTSAAAWSATPLDEINSQRVAYCQFFDWDKLCGGNEEAARYRHQQNSRNNLERKLFELSAEIVNSPDYIAKMAKLQNDYQNAPEEMRGTIKALSVYLNQVWLKRYKPEVEIWLSTADHENAGALASGFAAYSTVFAATPAFKNLPALHRVLRSRLPWVSLGVAAVATAAAVLPSRFPVVTPPPFQLLSFADTSDPIMDGGAQASHADFEMIRDIYPVAAAALVAVGAGPNWMNFAWTNAKGRYGIFKRFFLRAANATRVTPVTAVAGTVIGAAVSWAITHDRIVELTMQFQSVKDESPLAAQEMSLGLNGLHILMLGDVDAQVKHSDRLVELLLKSSQSDRDLRKNFNALAMTSVAFRSFLERPDLQRARNYATSIANTYAQFAAEAKSFSDSLVNLETESPLKAKVLAQRKASLEAQQAEMLDKQRNFPIDAFSQKLLAIYESTSPFGTERPRYVN